jgi:hypothetical protein
MSSEQRYDMSYNQFAEDSTTGPDLFDEFIETSAFEPSSYELQGESLANLQVPQPSATDMNSFDWDQSEQVGDIVNLPQSSTFATTQAPVADGFASMLDSSFLGAEPTNFNGGSLVSQGVYPSTGFYTDFNTSGFPVSDFGTLLSHQTTTEFVTSSDAVQREASNVEQSGPISVSFFFSITLTRRTVW